MHRHFGRLNRIVLIMDRRCGAGEVKDLVHFNEKRETDVVSHEFKPGMLKQMFDVALCAREQIVDAQHVMAIGKQPVDQVRAKKTSPARYEDAFGREIITCHSKSLSSNSLSDPALIADA